MEEPENEANICVRQIYATRMTVQVWVQQHLIFMPMWLKVLAYRSIIALSLQRYPDYTQIWLGLGMKLAAYVVRKGLEFLYWDL